MKSGEKAKEGMDSGVTSRVANIKKRQSQTARARRRVLKSGCQSLCLCLSVSLSPYLVVPNPSSLNSSSVSPRIIKPYYLFAFGLFSSRSGLQGKRVRSVYFRGVLVGGRERRDPYALTSWEFSSLLYLTSKWQCSEDCK